MMKKTEDDRSNIGPPGTPPTNHRLLPLLFEVTFVRDARAATRLEPHGWSHSPLATSQETIANRIQICASAMHYDR